MKLEGLRVLDLSAFLPGPPEDGFVHPIGFAGDLVRKAERLEHFHGAAGDAVCLADLERAGFALNDAGGDVRKSRQLRRQRQARRAAADDEDIDR